MKIVFDVLAFALAIVLISAALNPDQAGERLGHFMRAFDMALGGWR